jgi:hypothetical protein
MENTKSTVYDILMWGLVLGVIGYAGYVYQIMNVAMQAL